MSVQGFVDAIVAFVQTHESWAIPVAFLVAFMESFCFLSILWPGTAILVGISALLAKAGVCHEHPRRRRSSRPDSAARSAMRSPTGSAAISRTACSTPGHSTAIPSSSAQGKAFFDKYGAASVFLGHFFGPVRAIIPVVAGMYSMRQLPFQIANVASAFMWAAGVIAPGYFLVTFKTEIFDFIVGHEYIAAARHVRSRPAARAPHSAALLADSGRCCSAAGSSTSMPAAVSRWVMVAGVLGVFLGDMVGYRAGERRLGEPHAVWPLHLVSRRHSERHGLPREMGRLRRHRLSKFLGVGRAYVPVVAGATHMKASTFIP